jgi:threonine/homoserine/homoserine lactone efflux protein
LDFLVAFLLKGIAVGVIIAVPVGPVGVLCIRRTIFEGRLAGLFSGFGAATADALFGVIAAFGLTVISDLLLDYQTWLRLAGGGFLLYIGGKALLSPPQVEPPPRHRDPLLRDFASTFALTLTNPITIFVFLGVFAALGLSGAEATWGRAGFMVLGVWVGSLLWWTALIFGTGLFLRQFDQRHLSWINRGSGAILFLSGLALVGTVVAQRLGLA